MSQYILINNINVQNANAIAGFTWGFPAITHFLGFSHNLSRKLTEKQSFEGITLTGCAVVAHHHQIHTYKSSYDFEFTQSRNPPYLSSHAKDKTPPIIEEGKMNMVVSLIIECEGNVGNREDALLEWLKKICYLQRLAGGTILGIKAIELFRLDNQTIRKLKRKLLPGFLLMDRSQYLEQHFLELQKQNNSSKTELFDAWLDFIALKQKARPKSDIINEHFNYLTEDGGNDTNNQLKKFWNKHLDEPYHQNTIARELKQYFETIPKDNNANKKLLAQWNQYCNPSETTDADWEYMRKPNTGYLAPIMTGYKAISEVYSNNEVESTRDDETDVCFVESVHSVGEWLSVHRLQVEDFDSCLWHYAYEDNWYLCKQTPPTLDNTQKNEIITENPNDDF